MKPENFCSKRQLVVSRRHLTLGGVKQEDAEHCSEFTVAGDLMFHAIFSRFAGVQVVAWDRIEYSYRYYPDNLLLVLLGDRQHQVYETQVQISGCPEKIIGLVECLYWLNQPNNNLDLDQLNLPEKISRWRGLDLQDWLNRYNRGNPLPSWSLYFVAEFLTKYPTLLKKHLGLQQALKNYGYEINWDNDCTTSLCRLRRAIKNWFSNQNLSFQESWNLVKI